MAKVNLPALPALPSSARSARPLSSCVCGCGGLTQRSFVPGHDARLKGLIIRVLNAVMTLDEVEAWGASIGRGPQIRAAVEKGIASPALLKRWNIEVPAADVDEVENVEDDDIEQAS